MISLPFKTVAIQPIPGDRRVDDPFRPLVLESGKRKNRPKVKGSLRLAEISLRGRPVDVRMTSSERGRFEIDPIWNGTRKG